MFSPTYGSFIENEVKDLIFIDLYIGTDQKIRKVFRNIEERCGGYELRVIVFRNRLHGSGTSARNARDY